MISKNNAPTSEQKRWWSWLIERGCCICHNAAEIHHIKGAAYKLKPHGKIGNWLVLPLCYYHHRDQSNKSNVTEWKKAFEAENGSQDELLSNLYNEYIKETGAQQLGFI